MLALLRLVNFFPHRVVYARHKITLKRAVYVDQLQLRP